jgi:hypothetical protein
MRRHHHRYPSWRRRRERVVRVDNHADNECAEDVEEEDVVEGLADSRRDSLAGVLGLTDGDTDELGTHVGEEGEDKGVDKAEELAEAAGLLVGLEGLAVLPVAESEALLAGDTSEVDDETEENQTGEVTTLRRESQNSTSPNHLIPSKLSAKTSATRIVTHAAPLILASRNESTSAPATICWAR